MDLFALAKQAAELRKDEPLALSLNQKYVIIFTEQESVLSAQEIDVEKVEYMGEWIEEVNFKDGAGNIRPFKTADHKTKWIVIEQTSMLGSTLAAAYDEVVQAVKNQMPHEMQKKVKIIL